jgi:hypothetical protein
MNLPPFTPDATCPKCGHDVVRTIYHEHGRSGVCDSHGLSWRDGEHLVRVCQRCHYGWAEAVLEHAVRPAGEDGT